LSENRMRGRLHRAHKHARFANLPIQSSEQLH
jgi:hypothetical protein